MATARTASPTSSARESTKALLLIALFKLVKGVLLLAVGIGAIKLLHKDVAETVMRWVTVLRVDPDSRLMHGLLTHVLRVSPNQPKAIGVGTFVYAGLRLTEGTGLLLRKRWAEYFTIITTAGLIPGLPARITARHLPTHALTVGIFSVLNTRVLPFGERRTKTADPTHRRSYSARSLITFATTAWVASH